MYCGWFFTGEMRMCSVRMIKSDRHLIRLKKLEQHYGNIYFKSHSKIRFKFYKDIMGKKGILAFQKSIM